MITHRHLHIHLQPQNRMPSAGNRWWRNVKKLSCLIITKNFQITTTFYNSSGYNLNNFNYWPHLQ